MLFSFGLFQSTDVVPGSGWNLDDGLSQRGWVGVTLSVLEVVVGDSKGVENLSIDGIVLNINDVHFLTNALEGGLRADGSDIGTDETVSIFGN